MAEAPARYSGVAILLHWMTAAAVIFLLVLGPVMKRAPFDLALKFQLYQLHKSIGVTVFLLVVVRLMWRMSHKPPDYTVKLPVWQERAAHWGHWLLYALLLMMPLTGWALVSTALFQVPTVVFGMVELPHIGFLVASANEFRDLTHWVHPILGLCFALVILGHSIAAIYHDLVKREQVLARMLPFKRFLS